MDSKTKRIAVISVIFMLLIVFGSVILLNMDKIKQEKMNTALQSPDDENGFKNGDMLSEQELRAFLKDETFFDKESTGYQSKVRQNELSLLITSVEKDLRVKIVDPLGNPVSGESFYVTIDDVGEYKDLDKDGIVYIGGLRAGDYSVSLNEMNGYSVPNTKVKVSVKDKIEYTTIDDISFFIKSEEEVNAKIEDTEEKSADAEADKSENVLAKLEGDDYLFGIDVSKWNKDIDWEQVAESGVEFAIIRCGYRGSSTGSLVEDPYYKKNIEGATKAGIKVGLYFFTQATTEVEAVEEASMVISLCKEYQLEYPIFIDTEGAGGKGRADGLDKDMRTLVCEAFCKTIADAGYTPGVYASKNWYKDKLHLERLDGYAIWLAEYRNEPTFGGEYHMWQYTSKGEIEGINGRVDLNISYLE